MYGMAKSTSINLRITQEFREELQMLADYRGLTLSSLAHSLLVKSLRQERQVEPEAFQGERKANDSFGLNGGIAPVAPHSKSGGLNALKSRKESSKRKRRVGR